LKILGLPIAKVLSPPSRSPAKYPTGDLGL
jgi:hypothetical protein